MSLTSIATQFKVWYKDGASYKKLADALVTSVSIADFNGYSSAVFELPTKRVGDELVVTHGSRIKIIATETANNGSTSDTIVFMGVICSISQSASGTSGGGAAYENIAVKAYDYRWALNKRAVVHGIYGHGYSDYDFSAFDPADPLSATLSKSTGKYFSGKPCIFNPQGFTNCTLAPLAAKWEDKGDVYDVYLFVENRFGQRWKAKDMIMYLLFWGWSNFKELYDVETPEDFEGLDLDEFDTTPWHISIEGLHLVDALYAICREVGMRFREVYTLGEPRLQFYRPRRIAAGECKFKQLYCPAVGEDIDGDEDHPCWSFSVETDSAEQVTFAIAASAPERYEITAELVPSFADPSLSSAPNPPFLSDAEIMQSANPNANEVFSKYDSRGAAFLPDIFRLWTLNETGRYSYNPFDRDIPQDLADIIGTDAEADGKSRFGLFNRPLLPILTPIGATSDSSGIKLEFSFDGGQSWGPLPCNIINLDDCGGIWIAEPNLHNIKPPGEQTITGGDLDGVEGSFLTSVLSDILADHVFRIGTDRLPEGKYNWLTRIRVTACIELEQRRRLTASKEGGQLYRELYDFSGRYRYQKRGSSSLLTGVADTRDDTSQLQYHADTILEQNSRVKTSGNFTLAAIDLAFATGDIIGGITGRGLVFGSKDLLPDANGDIWATGAEIYQIIHEPIAQTTRLITADDRFTE